MSRIDAQALSYQLVEHLRAHRADSGHRCVLAKSLARTFDVDTRLIREAVEIARNRGELIASGSDGYFLAMSEVEILPTLVNLTARALSILTTRGALRRECRRRREGKVQLELLPATEPVRRSA